MTRSLLVILFSLLLSASVSAQSTVTNADLEKFRLKRLAAEKELRENYAKLGFPSPEELARQNAESARERDEFSARLERERLERERIAAEYRSLGARGETVVVVAEPQPQRNLIYGYGYGYTDPFNRYRRNYRYRGPQVIWRAGPGGVIYEPGGRSSFIWTPQTNRPRPFFRPNSRQQP